MDRIDRFKTKKSFFIHNSKYFYYSLDKLAKKYKAEINKIPFSIKILLENFIRNADNSNLNKDILENILKINKTKSKNLEILFHPTRILMQDFTGVPAITDLVAMREALSKKKVNPKYINPEVPVDLVIDHSVMVDSFGSENSFNFNVKKEFERNKERYEFLKWSQKAFSNFSVVPPGAGICHQVNLEYLAKTVWVKSINNKKYLFPDSLVGTDSHTTMINALSVLGWGVGGIEAEAAMLGQPITMKIPEVVGVKIKGKLSEGITATDLVLTVTEKLRSKGVVGKFVEFFGNGLKNITLPDRATISNMAPEYGATCGFFPVDQETINYLELTGRSKKHLQIIKKYSILQGLWSDDKVNAKYDDLIVIDLSDIKACLAGPKRPQDKVFLDMVPKTLKKLIKNNKKILDEKNNKTINDGSIVIAAITSCTNTSNPNVLVAAGLVAKKAVEKGLRIKHWVKTSFAPGSKVVTEYLDKSGLLKYLNILGFNIVGYGCTTCIGNSGPLKEEISSIIKSKNLTVCSILSGNRNFEGRVHPEIKANYLASPPLVIIYALLGNVKIDITKHPIGTDKNNKKVYLKDLWPTNFEIQKIVQSNLKKSIFIDKYKNINKGDQNWKKINIDNDPTYKWNLSSTYVKHPPFFFNIDNNQSKSIINAKALAILGDSVTTDHISPAGSIAIDSPAGKYLINRQIPIKNFNSYGSRRGNHEIMIRGTFSNIRLKNEMLDGIEGGFTKFNGKILSIFEAAMKYFDKKIPLIIIAGKEYGTGSSRDWAAKGTKLLGIRAVIAESYERIHRSNLIGMGVIPLEFSKNQNRKKLKLNGDELFTINNINKLMPKQKIKCTINKKNSSQNINLLCRIDTNQEMEYYKAGGILQYVLNNILKNSK